MTTLPCPYLNTDVELTDERENHIRDKHPELLPVYRAQFIRTIADPDAVRKDFRFPNSMMFSRWFPDIKEGKFVVVVVIADPSPAKRHWVVTAYVARQLSGGTVIWQRP